MSDDTYYPDSEGQIDTGNSDDSPKAKLGGLADRPSPKDDYPDVAVLEADVESYGEVHSIVEEFESEVELRRGTTDFDYEVGLITVDDGQTLHRIGMDRVVSWYLPTSMLH